MLPSMYQNQSIKKAQVLAAFREYKNFGLTLEQGEVEFMKWHGPVTTSVRALAQQVYQDESIQDETIKSVVKVESKVQTEIKEIHESVWIVE